VIWRKQLLKLKIFHDLFSFIEKQENHQAEKEFVLEKIVMAFPSENWETMFDTLVRWARFGNLFSYEEETTHLSLAKS